MKVTVYLEKSDDGLYCAYTPSHGINGYGDTEEEAKEDFLDAVAEFFGKGWCEDNLEFEFKRKEQ